eukprot:309410-Chlamydomonas_euryale.AAC.4
MQAGLAHWQRSQWRGHSRCALTFTVTAAPWSLRSHFHCRSRHLEPAPSASRPEQQPPSIRTHAHALCARRRRLHSLLWLPMDRPALRVASALTWQAGDADAGGDGGGGGGGCDPQHRLQNVHDGVPLPGDARDCHLVQGAYDYHHYMQVWETCCALRSSAAAALMRSRASMPCPYVFAGALPALMRSWASMRCPCVFAEALPAFICSWASMPCPCVFCWGVAAALMRSKGSISR